MDGKMARKPHRRNNMFRNHLRLAANNHWVQRHVAKGVANQRRKTITGTHNAVWPSCRRGGTALTHIRWYIRSA